MSVAWIESRKGAIVVSPHQGAIDGPHQPYPTARPNGRGPDRPVLPHRRRLRPSQPERGALRIAQAALGLGDHHPRPPAAASWGGVGALLLARHPEVFLSPVSGGGRAPSFLVPPPGEEAQALLGASAAGGGGGTGRRPRDADRGLDAPFCPAPAP